LVASTANAASLTWDAVPDPLSLILLGTGFAAVAATARRRNKSGRDAAWFDGAKACIGPITLVTGTTAASNGAATSVESPI